MLARERPAVGPIPDTGTLRTITAFFAQCAIVGVGGPPRYEEQPPPFGCLLGCTGSSVITAFFAQCAIVGLGGPPRYEEQPPPFGCLLGCTGSSVTDILCQRSDAFPGQRQGRCYYFVHFCDRHHSASAPAALVSFRLIVAQT